MSSKALKLLALFTVVLGAAAQTRPLETVTNLLREDAFEQAESLLETQPRNAATAALRGEIEFRKGNFSAAESSYKAALDMDRRTARAHFGIGKLAMARMKNKEAVSSIMRAVELDPDEPLYRIYASEAWAMDENFAEQRKQLEAYIRLNPAYDPDRLEEAKAAAEILKVFGSERMGVVEAPEEVKAIRLRRSLHLLFARVTLDGKGPYEFVIDTGASATVISGKVASELGLNPITTTLIHGVGAGRNESKIYKVNELTIGGIKIKNLPTGTFDDPLLTQLADGIFSTALLADFKITINYPENQLELSRGSPVSDADILPTWYFNNLLLVPLAVNGKHRGNFLIDTGAVTTVISHSMARTLGVTDQSPGAKIDIGITGIGGFSGTVLAIADVSLATSKNTETFPQVVAIDLKHVSKQIGTEVAGVLGYDFFEKYKVTINYYGAELRLQR